MGLAVGQGVLVCCLCLSGVCCLCTRCAGLNFTLCAFCCWNIAALRCSLSALHNSLAAFPTALCSMPSLEMLDLSSNRLDELGVSAAERELFRIELR